MKRMKRILATLLALIMIISVTPVLAEETDVTVYVSISKYGEIQTAEDGTKMAYAPVILSGQDSYTVDDALREAHRLYCPDGTDGYASSISDWGLGVDILWGDTSYNFGYYINGRTSTLLGDAVCDGTYIDAFVYENIYTEKYSAFNLPENKVDKEEEFELELSYITYDENWNPSFLPCEGATITVNGEDTELITDENGCVALSFSETGRYIVSAYKDETITDDNGEEEVVPTITAPVCVISVVPTVEDVVHNIAAYYKEIDMSEAGGNLPWIVADMMMYEGIFPESEYILSKKEKTSAAELMVENAIESESAGDMAKTIIGLSALGYDAEKIITEDYENINLTERLTDLVDDEDDSVLNIYSLPYVIIALSQNESYCTEEQMEYLINSAVESKELWLDTTFGTDGMTPMILALSPYYDSSDVKAAIEDAIEIIKINQRDDGLISGPEDFEAASTGLAICAFSALGEDVMDIAKGEFNLIDGIMSTVNEEGNSFSNAFATEQGFRGLLGWMMLDERKVYDFSDYEKEKLNLSDTEFCPVKFVVSPRSAKVIIKDVVEIDNNMFDLPEGTYEYNITASGYVSETGKVKVKSEDADNIILKEIKVSLNKKSSGGSGGSSFYPTEDKKEDKPEENPIPEEKPIEDKNIFPDVSGDDWFAPAVKYVYENNLFKGTDKGFEPETPMTRAMLVTVLYRMAGVNNEIAENPYTDVADNEWYADAVKWAAANQIVTGVSADMFAPDENITREQLAVIMYRYSLKMGYSIKEDDVNVMAYSDFGEFSDYAIDGIEYMVKIGVMNGRTENTFAPKESATRAEVATMLMRFCEAIENE